MRWSGRQSAQTVERAGIREPETERNVCRPQLGVQVSEGCGRNIILTIGARRQWVTYGLGKYRLSVRQVYRALSLHRSVYRYQPKPKDGYCDTVGACLLGLSLRFPNPTKA